MEREKVALLSTAMLLFAFAFFALALAAVMVSLGRSVKAFRQGYLELDEYIMRQSF